MSSDNSADGGLSCPFCGTDEIGVVRHRERDDGHIIDVECDTGHVGTVVFPARINAAEVLADATGEPAEKYEADFEEYPMPDPDDLESVEVDDE